MRNTLQAGYNCHQGMGLALFTEDELYAIHCATLEVLSTAGIKVSGEEERQIFADGGATI